MPRVSRAESNGYKLFKHFINLYTTETRQEIDKVKEWVDADDYAEEVGKAKFLLDSVLEAMNYESFLPPIVVEKIHTGEYFRIGKNSDGEYILTQQGKETPVPEDAVKNVPEFRAGMWYYDFISKKGTDIRFFNYGGIKYVLTMYGFDQIKGNIVSLNYKNINSNINLDIYCQFGFSDKSILMTYKLDGKVVLQQEHKLEYRDRMMIDNSREDNENSI